MIVVVDPVGAMIVLVLTTAALAALCGYLAGWRQRRHHRGHGYFVLGVLTGLVGHSLARRRLARLTVLNHPAVGAALQVRRVLTRARISVTPRPAAARRR